MRLVVCLSLALTLAGCGSGDGAVTRDGNVIFKGTLVDAPIVNVTYTAEATAGITDGDGRFDYEPGDVMVFSFGGHDFVGIDPGPVVSVLDLFQTTTIDQDVLNLARLLLSIDADSEPNRIEIPDLSGQDLSTLDFDQEPTQFTLDPIVVNLLAALGVTMVDAGVAIDHLFDSAETYDFPIDGMGPGLDADGDGIFNSEDPDDDNDGVVDTDDDFPLNPLESRDTDGDGIGDNEDPDDDNDGLLDELDNDTDNDGLSDDDEVAAGTDPTNSDSDNDGMLDGYDFFPTQSGMTLYVAAAGDDLNDCLTPATACASIEMTAQRALPGDVVEVGAGIYTGSVSLVTGQLTVRGASPGATIVQAAVDLASSPGEVFSISGSTQLENMTIRHGTGVLGAAIRVGGGSTISDCIIETNVAGDPDNGAAVYASGLSFGMIGTTVRNNTGHGVSAGGNVGIDFSTIANNTVDGLVMRSGSVGLLRRTTFENNGRHGIHHLSGSESEVLQSTLTGHPSVAVLFDSDVGIAFNNSTISGNPGGAVFSTEGAISMDHATLVGNGTTQPAIVGTITLIISNSIIQGQTCNRQASAGANNLIDDTACGTGEFFRLGVPLGVDPQLRDNGGPTLTHALERNSNALDRISCPTSPTSDQRGQLRPGGPGCDLGSYEFQP